LQLRRMTSDRQKAYLEAVGNLTKYHGIAPDRDSPGSLAEITFLVKGDAPAGSTTINLRANLPTGEVTSLEGIDDNGDPFTFDLEPTPSDTAGDSLDGSIMVLAPTTTTVSPAAATTTLGTPITGTVTFEDGGVSIGSATLSAGASTFSTSSLAASSHTLTVLYAGSASYSGSTSDGLVETITS
jgi:hypothetical protein